MSASLSCIHDHFMILLVPSDKTAICFAKLCRVIVNLAVFFAYLARTRTYLSFSNFFLANPSQLSVGQQLFSDILLSEFKIHFLPMCHQ